MSFDNAVAEPAAAVVVAATPGNKVKWGFRRTKATTRITQTLTTLVKGTVNGNLPLSDAALCEYIIKLLIEFKYCQLLSLSLCYIILMMLMKIIIVKKSD